MGVSYDIMIPSRTTLVLFNISIINDDTLEDTEDFTVIIMSFQSGITISNPDQAVITIVDDDGKQLL